MQVCKKKKNKKEKKNNKKMTDFFEGLYLRNSWCDLLQIWYEFSPDMPAPVQQIWFCSDERSRSYEQA